MFTNVWDRNKETGEIEGHSVIITGKNDKDGTYNFMDSKTGKTFEAKKDIFGSDYDMEISGKK